MVETAYHPVRSAGGFVGLTPFGLAAILGISRVALARWTRGGLVAPLYRGGGARGPAGVSLYGPLEAVAFGIVRALRRRGVSLKRVRRLAAMLREKGGFRAIAEGRLGIVVPDARGEPVRVLEKGRLYDELGQGWLAGLFFDPTETARVVRARILKLERGREILARAA
jgi:DNA-binding transcriptional MerR regulator